MIEKHPPAKARLQRRLLDHPRAYVLLHRAYVILRYLARRPHEADFAGFAHFHDRTGLFLDVGANSGASALSFRLYHPTGSILSIEPNPLHERDLKLVKRLVANFDYMICAAGDENTTLTLNMPVYKGIPLTGEASLVRDDLEQSWTLARLAEEPVPGGFEIIELPVQVRRLDDLGLAPDFVKVDVEGFELDVLRGLRRTLEVHRPILLVEAAKRVDEIKGFLGDLDYGAYVYRPTDDRLEAHTGEATTNLFFLPV